MVIQPRFCGAAPLFFSLLTSGASCPSPSKRPGQTASTVSCSSTMPSVPAPLDDTPRPDLVVEQWLDGVGSVSRAGGGERDRARRGRSVGRSICRIEPRGRHRSARRPRVPGTVNPQVQHFLDRFTGARREVVNLWAGRSGRYLGMIRDVLKSRGLPEELAYTAMIESGFNPLAVSRAGAKGMWQFMAGTARRYGLRVDQWIDERLDPEKSTVAASQYLRDLYNMFGSWTLAQAAYNAGEVKVSRAIRATGSSDFWTLAKTNHLRTETKEFVPAIHAATLIAQNPAQYGFEFTEPGPLGRRDRRRAARPPISDVWRRRPGMRLAALQTLNPMLVRSITPPGDPWQITGARRHQHCVLSALAPAARAAGGPQPPYGAAPSGPAPPADEVHVVRPRDTVGSIAKQYGDGGAGRTPLEPSPGGGTDPAGRPAPGRRLPLAPVRRTGRVQVRIEVQLFATLAAFLPPDSREGAATLEVPDRSTVRDVIERLRLPSGSRARHPGQWRRCRARAPPACRRRRDRVSPARRRRLISGSPSASSAPRSGVVHSSGRNGAHRSTGSV